jgi:hypothetical protein
MIALHLEALGNPLSFARIARWLDYWDYYNQCAARRCCYRGGEDHPSPCRRSCGVKLEAA